ncbi:MAG: maltose alpha-D-glucosyltransferase [Deltaproteobacteria bacterium]
MSAKDFRLEDDPFWYKKAIIYELHVKSFCDSNGDGTGDFQGLISRLDYLQTLGVTAVWLLPFYPSPLRDDGYDIADYTDINPDYGTLADFKEFLRAAHRRGIRVITELVINHTSDQHPWFQRARRAKTGSAWRNFYVWSDTVKKYADARVIFKDFESSNWTWDAEARAYYWHRFYSHQPDLNFESRLVQREIFRVVDFWLGMGVDGLRLDAVPYLYEEEGTNCENLETTHVFLKKLRAHVDGRFKNRMLLCEANQWPEDAAAYFGKGDECHMAFHFPVMPRLFMSLWMEDRFPLIDILQQTPAIPANCQWAMFLRNHDELTLEMVTDEERDYMYRAFAEDQRARINLGIRRRLAPLLDNNRRRMELMQMLLLSLPGTPVIYYGDEIGMGDNYYLGDRDGVRTPMQWSPDRNAGFSKAPPQKLFLPVIVDSEYHYEAVNVENQEANLTSILWWMRRVLGMRKKLKALSLGGIEFVGSDNPKVLSFTRTREEETVLVVVNLSRFSQPVHLDLGAYAGHVPEEVFSGNRFPEIDAAPYALTLGFHDYFWFVLRKQEAAVEAKKDEGLPECVFRRSWETLGDADVQTLEELLPRYLNACRWFGGKARRLRRLKIIEDFPMSYDGRTAHLLLLESAYAEGAHDHYMLPVSFATDERALSVAKESPQAVVGRARIEAKDGILYDAAYDPAFHRTLLECVAKRRRVRGRRARIIALPGHRFRELLGAAPQEIVSHIGKAEQSNTSIFYGDRLFLKLYRRLEPGMNPDLEVERFLTEKTEFDRIPPFAGALEIKGLTREPISLGLLEGFVASETDAWSYALDNAKKFFEQILARAPGATCQVEGVCLFDAAPSASFDPLKESLGTVFLDMVQLLGRRTGEFHRAMASSSAGDFAPEPFSKLYQRAVYQSMTGLTRRVMQTLAGKVKTLPASVREDAKTVLEAEGHINASFQKILTRKFSATKIRIHGDYHLGQALFTGKDFYIIDFEGEPARALSERRLKRSALRDVAGMLRSFHYAAYATFFLKAATQPEDVARLMPWADFWACAVGNAFLRSYVETVGPAPFVPKAREEFNDLLRAFILEKAVYELGYELNNRPEWIVIPVKGIQYILKEHFSAPKKQ